MGGAIFSPSHQKPSYLSCHCMRPLFWPYHKGFFCSRSFGHNEKIPKPSQYILLSAISQVLQLMKKKKTAPAIRFRIIFSEDSAPFSDRVKRESTHKKTISLLEIRSFSCIWYMRKRAHSHAGGVGDTNLFGDAFQGEDEMQPVKERSKKNL